MKKTTIACMALFSLVACSEDAYEQLSEQNSESGSQYVTNSFNNDQPGHAHGDTGNSGVIWEGDNYASPWDIWYRQEFRKQPSYIIANGNAEDITPLDLRVTPIVGLAYYDGVTDGLYHDVANPLNPPIDLSNGNYPNLYDGVNEVGMLVRGDTFFVNAYPSPSHSIRMESQTDHLPRPGVNPAYPGITQGFTFPGLTNAETQLLAEFGKVFWYQVEVFHKNNNVKFWTIDLSPEVSTLTGPMPFNNDWKPILDSSGNHLAGNALSMGYGNIIRLFYYNAGLPNGTFWDINNPSVGICDSREVVYNNGPWQQPNIHAIPGTNYNIELKFLQSSSYLWLNSSLYLRVSKK